MRKTILSLMAVILTSGIVCAAPASASSMKLQTLSSRSLELQKNLESHRVNEKKAFSAPKKVAPEITNPEGISKYYTKDQEVNYYGMFFEDFGLAAEIVYGEDNSVYFADIISDLPYNTYVKGTLEDDIITMELPQTIIYSEAQDIGYLLSLVKYDDTIQDYVACEGNVEFVVFEDGTISLDLPGNINGSYGLGVIDNYGEYMFICNTSQVYTPFDIPVNVLPEGVETETYYFIDANYGSSVEVGFDDDHLYLLGLYNDIKPTVPIIADLNGSQATITQDQLLGSLVGYFIVTKCAEKTAEGFVLADETAMTILNVDRENKVITYAESSPFLVINADLYTLFYVALYQDFLLKPQTTFSGIPKNPVNLTFNDEYLIMFGYYSFLFDIPNISTEDNVLVDEDLYYRVFLNGKLCEFEESGDQYVGIDLTSEIPYLFSNGNDLFYNYGAQREVGFYTDDIKTLGVQSIYKYQGDITESAIVTLDLETGEVSESSPESGINTVGANDISKTEYFDLTGRKVTNPGEGFFIKRSILSNGKVITNKVLKR